MPAELDGLTILHLTDFHAGTPSLNVRAMRKAVELGVRWQPDLVALTGDILGHGRARGAVVAAMEGLRPPLGMFAVLGNHDVGDTHDPFSRGIVIDDWGEAPVTLLRDRSAVVEGAGVRSRSPAWSRDLRGWTQPAAGEAVRPDALRILLTHFPEVPAEMPRGGVFAHAVRASARRPDLPAVPSGKIRLSHRSYRYDEGVFEEPETTVVVSRGLGTTLVPFRLFARPEVSLLRLRPR